MHGKWGFAKKGRLALLLALWCAALLAAGQSVFASGLTSWKLVLEIKNKEGDTPLRRPRAVVVDNKGRIIVLEAAEKVVIYDGQGKFVKEFGKKGRKEGSFNDPLGLAVDAEGRIYVSDTGNARVEVFSPEGELLLSFGEKGSGPGQFLRPGPMAIGNGLLYVVDIENHRVSAFDLSGKHKFDFGEKGQDDGQLLYPLGIAIDRAGYIYVVNSLNFRIEVYNKDGKFEYNFGEAGDTEGTFSRPKNVAFDQKDNLYVTDSLLSLVQILDTDGNYVGKVGGDSEIPLFAQPLGIWVDAKGRVYVADQGNDRIAVFEAQ
ncbi:MAG: NHL repeat-containing protein [Bacillota bacterium]|nr:NHL repeat-containing protein [Bacillota bacterium]